MLIDKFGDQVADNLDFNLGYFEGSKKRWLCSTEDLNAMYKSLKKDEEVLLWCESIVNLSKRKKEEGVPVSKRQAKEDEIDSTFQSLKKKHNEKYEIPKLQLWARMITSGLHYDGSNWYMKVLKSPQIYLHFIGVELRRKKQQLKQLVE